MRVIGGNLKGRKLAVVRGMAIRPTADRVREALFNILGTRPVNARVLDLFAGTGAMGIEALSRGARQAVFVDQAASAIGLLRRNIALCRLEAHVRLIRWNILKDLKVLSPYPETFDLVFIDPPYGQQMIAVTLRHLVASRSLAPLATIVVEHASAEPIDFPPPVVLADQRRYGGTQLSFCQLPQGGDS